jgi:hypothetical protein
MDAARREVTDPDGMTVVFGGEEFVFPAELPMSVLDPILSPQLDLVGVVTSVMDDNRGLTNGLLDTLLLRPNLPREVLDAFLDIYRQLLGVEEFAQFAGHNPSVQDYVRLTKALATAYGASLGKFFGLLSSPDGSGETSSSTSPDTTSSMPEGSGSGPATGDSSASGA